MPVPAGYSPVTIPAGLHNANGIARRNRLVLIQVDGQWCAPTAQAATLQFLVDNTDPLPDQKQDLLDQVAAERARRDTALAGDAGAQLANLTAAVSLLAKIAYLGQPLTPAETALADGVLGSYAAHLALAAAADALAADVNALTSPAAAFAFDVAGDSRWAGVDPASIVMDYGVFVPGVFDDGLS